MKKNILHWLTDQPTEQSTDEPTYWMTKQAIDQPTDWLTKQATDQQADWPTDKPILENLEVLPSSEHNKDKEQPFILFSIVIR